MRGNATLLALVVIAAMTTSSLQLWRLWSMHAAVLHERDHCYQQWFKANAGFEGVIRLLQASYDEYALQAKAQGHCKLLMPDGLQKAGVVSAIMRYTQPDLFVIIVTMQQANIIRFLVEKKVYAASSYIIVHHVTFGAVV